MPKTERKGVVGARMRMQGLTDEQVVRSRKQFGSNCMTEQKREGFLRKLLGNFKDPMIQILCVALGLNFIFAILGETHWYEALGIAVAVLLAVLVSTFSEHRNEHAFQRLQEEAAKILCKVYRNGVLVELPIDEIVVDDWVMLQLGDKIPADGLMRQGTIQVDQSALNGEAEEAEKKELPVGTVDPRENLNFLNPHQVFRGSVVCGGSGVMQVTTVGDSSVYGRLAGELQLEERDSPLKVKLKDLAKTISRFGYWGGLIIALAFLFQQIVVQNGFDPVLIGAYCSDGITLLANLLQAVMLAVIIIVMAVPEGLPLMIAIVSAQNMGKMLKDYVLVRKVTGIETAGSLNLLLSDKTGTITKGQLETVAFLDGTGQSYAALSEISSKLSSLITLNVIYNNNAILSKNPDGTNVIIGGNATERAMLEFVGQSPESKATVLSRVPFNSVNKYSLASLSVGQHIMTLVKGAPEIILSCCNTFYTSEGEPRPLSDSDRAKLERKIDDLAHRAIRVLVLAAAPEERGEESLNEVGWTLIGIMGIRDEVRTEAVKAIAQVQKAGVQVVMITGDRKETAMAIAQESGILRKKSDLIFTSDELSELSDAALKELLPNIRVIARALPSDKSRLVRLAQEQNLVVGMTGDGVNDAPALKRADVGFAMGSGTEVAKEAGDIVILNDNFQSVAKAILYGRTIYNSIRKFIVFQLTINVSAVLISFLAPLLGLESPLTITQILWINLVMDTLAAMAFGGEPTLEEYMEEKPRRRDESILSPVMHSAIITGAFWTLAVSLFLLLSPYAIQVFRSSPEDSYHMTGYFTFFIFAAIFNAFNARSEGRNLLDHLKDNPGFMKMIGLIVAVQIVLTQVGGPIFRCYGLTIEEWLFVLVLAFLIIPIDLLRKTVFTKQKKMILKKAV